MNDTQLAALAAALEPRLEPGTFVFCCLENGAYGDLADLEPVGMFLEKEGMTLILPASRAKNADLPCSPEHRLISLGVASSLDAVGLTAEVSATLSAESIPANVVAAFHHDHVFVPASLAARALDALRTLQRRFAARRKPGPGDD